MVKLSIHVPFEVKYFFVVFNLAACAFLVILRVYHQRKQKIEKPKLIFTGLSSMVLALLCCSTSFNIASHWYFGDIRWCDLSIKLTTTTYALHRVTLYIFIILRVEVLNQGNVVSPRLIYAGKAVIGVTGIYMVIASIAFTRGVADEHSSCSFDVIYDGILVLLWVTDTSICVAGTWMFIHPIEQTFGNIGNRTVGKMLRKTKIWSIVSLVSTLVAMLTVGVIDGAAGVIGFDCSITSLSLVMMMVSERRELPSKSSSLLSMEGSVELRVKTSVAQEKPPSVHAPSSGLKLRLSEAILLDKVMKGFISDDSNDSY